MKYDPMATHPCEKCGKSIMGRFGVCVICGLASQQIQKGVAYSLTPDYVHPDGRICPGDKFLIGEICEWEGK